MPYSSLLGVLLVLLACVPAQAGDAIPLTDMKVQTGPLETTGCLAVDGDYTQVAGGSLFIRIGGIDPCDEYDRLDVSGAAALAGTLNVRLANGFEATLGESYTIVTCSPCTGMFSTTNLQPPGPGLQWNISYFDDSVVLDTGPGAPEPDLALIKIANPDPVTSGETLTYTLTVTNRGPDDDATGVTVTDFLPGSVSFLSANASQGRCGDLDGVVTCDLGDLANGVMATITIEVRPAAAGSITNTASVMANEVDPDLENNSSTTETTVFGVCGVGGDVDCDETPCSLFDVIDGIDQALGVGTITCEADVICSGTVDLFDINCMIDCALDRPNHCLVEPCVNVTLPSACLAGPLRGKPDRTAATPNPVVATIQSGDGWQTEAVVRVKNPTEDLRGLSFVFKLEPPWSVASIVARGVPDSFRVFHHHEGRTLRLMLVSPAGDRVVAGGEIAIELSLIQLGEAPRSRASSVELVGVDGADGLGHPMRLELGGKR